MSNGFERRKEQSKEEIRRAAWELFGQFGVERVSMGDIARKAGVAQATIYNHFESKQTLAREFASAAMDGLIRGFEEVLSPEMPFPEKMSAFVSHIGELLSQGQPPAASTTIFTSSADLQDDPEIGKLRSASREKMTKLLIRLAAEGREQGLLDPRVSVEALDVYFRAFMDVFIDPQLHRRFSSSRELVTELGSLMLYGLTGPGVVPAGPEGAPAARLDP